MKIIKITKALLAITLLSLGGEALADQRIKDLAQVGGFRPAEPP